MKREHSFEQEKRTFSVALAGNPNVGKSTVFNALTGLRQHTGNWTGKTVETARGLRRENGRTYEIIDLPGTYSLSARSGEEEVARDFLCFGGAEAVVAVCDATHLARNLGLVFQILEITPRVVLVVNLIDEAKRHHISVDTEALSALLGIPVVAASAARGVGISEILPQTERLGEREVLLARYPEPLEMAAASLCEKLSDVEMPSGVSARFIALRLLENDEVFLKKLNAHLNGALFTSEIETVVREKREALAREGYDEKRLVVEIATAILSCAKRTAETVTRAPKTEPRFSAADRLLTSRLFGIPAMLLLLFVIFWLTTVGANAPSEALSALFGSWEMPIYTWLLYLGVSDFFAEMLVFGLYRTLAWVVSVMLPPMAIFFPLFTVLEDIGYLPRVAYNLDGVFAHCGACGKQGLTMCMGLGCNAVGVVGARIIDSRRERLIAILTNSFMPCNGRFPAMIAVATVFFLGAGQENSFLAALVLLGAVAFGALMSFFVSFLLSKTLLRGKGGAFVLELPPYRRPQIGKIIVRSLLDRTIFVLGRAVTIAAPAGVGIFLLSHLTVGGVTITAHISGFLEPLGALMGLDGVILLAFLLGLPANEIVLPICLMLYRADGVLMEMDSLSSVFDLLSANGWSAETALLFLIFMVLHSPCATTLMTVKKETGKLRYALFAFLLPTVLGIAVCTGLHVVFSLV